MCHMSSRRRLPLTRLPLWALVVVAAWLAIPATALAAAGDLDPTFSGDGKTTTDFFGNTDEVHDITVQPDGKIVAVGRTRGDVALARYKSNGALDPTFSGDGRQSLDFNRDFAEADGVALQP